MGKLSVITMIDTQLLIERGATYLNLPPEEVLFQEGSQCRYYFQVVSGQVRWVNINQAGNEYLQTLVEQGESIGELPLFDGKLYAATAIANKPTCLLRLPKEDFHRLLIDFPQIHFSFSSLLAQRLRFKFFMLKKMAQHDPEDIIETLLEYLSEQKSHICATCNQVQLTRRQIAEMTGLRVETVIRVMKNLNSKGVLRIYRRKVYFGDPASCVHAQCKRVGLKRDNQKPGKFVIGMNHY